MVLVLGFLVLISALIVSFFSSVSTELTSAKSSQASVSTRQLAESTTNLVISQIADATTGYKDSKNPSDGVLAWASQPGMIRTYDDKGDPYRYYKLYSSRNMVMQNIPSGYNIVTDEFARDVPEDWYRHPATYVDLNAPVRTVDENYEYPIVNPMAQKKSATARTITDGGVEGFEIINPPGYTGTTTRPENSYNPTSSPEANPAPMPVRWIYVLKDGTIISAPEPQADGTLDWSGVGDAQYRPTQNNPIVGRLAFWTDDDTAKVNINTATEGVFWDRPWARNGIGGTESNFAAYIPAQNEFQRYAGHPAMTCLSPVLGWVLPYQTVFDKSKYYFLVPRVMDGGTRAGTTRPSNTNPLVSDNERLFASVDELAFAPPQSSDTANGYRKPPTAFSNLLNSGPNTPGIDQVINRMRFFLTANSRAPEVNLFNKPRIGLWPVQSDPRIRDAVDRASSALPRNPKDKLIAFCGQTGTSTNPTIYYFQRYNEYVFNGNKIYGDGRSFTRPQSQPSSTSPIMDFEKIDRNQELYAYLQKYTGRNIPGFGGNFKDKYDEGLPTNHQLPTGETRSYSDRDQILTQMMDYIRTNVNSYSTAQNMAPQYDYAPTRRGGPVAGETQLVPLVLPNNTKGFGRFATVTEAAIVFTRDNTFLRAHLILEVFNPTPGLASWSPHVRYEVAGLDGVHPRTGATTDAFKVSGSAFGNNLVSMNWPQSRQIGNRRVWPWNFVTSRVGYSGGGHNMPFMGTWANFRYFSGGGTDANKTAAVGNCSESQYPFYTQPGNNAARIVNAGGTFDFEGGDLEIRIYSGFENVSWPSRAPGTNQLVQTIRMNFPRFTGMPLPTASANFESRISQGAGNLITAGDIVRSVEARPNRYVENGQNGDYIGGDLRLISGSPIVPEKYFAPHFAYNAAGTRLAHSIRSEENAYQPNNGSSITLIPGVGYNRQPAAARGTTEARNIAGAGDFDNATGDGEDGAYVNKADEGNLATGDGGYFSRGSFNVENGETFSPNRQISSAVSFGSLPTGVKRSEYGADTGDPTLARPWQTLLFTPYPSSRTTANATNHPGFGESRAGDETRPPYIKPPDHLFLDLFTMPIVEPYAISEPFSTAGKVNLNYQIAPFTYIKRTTGLHAVLRSTKVTAIPTTSSDKNQLRRYDINPDVGGSADGSQLEGSQKGTLYGFYKKLYLEGDLFRSASQICDIGLVPEGPGVNVSYDSLPTFWNQNRRTGDNVREIPYGHIYPRVTTKSNTYTVHMRVQSLRKARNSDPAKWVEGRDQVLSEYRGSTSLERYIDAADPTLPDFASGSILADKDNLDRHYRFRIIATKAFNP